MQKKHLFLVILGYLHFYINFKISLILQKKSFGILVVIAMNLEITIRKTDILTVSSHPVLDLIIFATVSFNLKTLYVYVFSLELFL